MKSRLIVPAAALILLTISCGGEDDIQKEEGFDSDGSLSVAEGVFTGETSKNRDVYIHVNNQSQVDSITIEVKVNFNCIYTFYSDTAILYDHTRKKFEARLTNPFIFICGNSDYPVLEGTIKDDNTINGTISQFKQCGGYCGSQLIIGTESTVSEHHWEITRKGS